MAEATEPESFSPNSARMAAEDLLEALPRSKKLQYLGNLNEILVVIERLAAKAKHDKAKAV